MRIEVKFNNIPGQQPITNFVPPATAQFVFEVGHTVDITNGPGGNPDPVDSGGAVSLSLNATDSLGHVLSYAWTASCPAVLGSNGSFSNPTVWNPIWTAPVNTTGGLQNCTIGVTVDDGQGLSQSKSYSQGVDSIAHILKLLNNSAGVPNPVGSGGTVSLSVSATDSLEHELSYAWTASCPAVLGSNGSFSDPNIQAPTWLAPVNKTGSTQGCQIKVTITDGHELTLGSLYTQEVSSVEHVLTINTGPGSSPNPVASGDVVNVSVGATDSLDHTLSYTWTASCPPALGSNGSFSNPNIQAPTWTAPANTTGSQQNCTIEVTVSDGHGLSQLGSYSQGVNSVPHTLTISNGPNGSPNPAAPGDTVSLSVNAVDSWNHTLSYAWTASCPAELGSTGSFSNSSIPNPTWMAPVNTTGSQQTCTIGVTVSDGQGLSQLGSYSQGVDPCTYAASPTSRSHGAGTEMGDVNVTAQTGCPWTTVSNNPSWITVTSGSPGTGNGTVKYSVAANTGTTSRTGTLTIAGKTFTVQQHGSCLYSGVIVRVTTMPGASPSTIYFRTSALSSVVFSGTTSDAKLINAALHALRKQPRVIVAGTAATCPASTAGGNIGAINFLIVNP